MQQLAASGFQSRKFSLGIFEHSEQDLAALIDLHETLPCNFDNLGGQGTSMLYQGLFNYFD